MKSVRFTTRSLPVAVAIVTVAAYGLLLPFTGFYWDDWPFAWTARFLGPAAFIPAFRGFRPFLGPIFFLTTSLIPPDPILWQIFALVIRFLAALVAWFALDKVWPAHRSLTIPAALLFLVFPGYSQHWVALTHINQEWIPLIFYLLSLAFSLRAFRASGSAVRDRILAIVFLIVGLFPTEYFVGLEPLRFMFFCVVAAESTPTWKQRLARSLKSWLPYLLIWLLDLAWLLYFYRSGVYISYDLTAASAFPPPLQAVFIFVDAVWKAGIYIWLQVIPLVLKSITAPSSLLSLGLALVSFAAAAFYLLKLAPDSSIPSSRASSSQDSSAPSAFALPSLAIGLVGILLGRVPSFAAALPLTLQSSFDRFMISMMLGGSLFISGLVVLLVRNRLARTLVFAALLGLGIGQQFFNANIFRRDWQGQQQVYWEMAWRMPALQQGTAILTQQMPLDYETDLSMTAVLNWIYAPAEDPASLSYALVYTEKRLGGPVLPSLNPDTAMMLPFRLVTFRGNTSNTITVYVPHVGCLRVLDPSLGDLETYGSYPASLTRSIGLSDPSLITAGTKPVSPPDPPFGPEPARTWCYYYEKAELARQAGEGQAIATLGNEATQKGFAPQDPVEWLPFIEGYARTGEVTLAEKIARQAWSDDPKAHHGLCVVWQRVASDGPQAARTVAASLLGQFGCGH